MVIAAIIAFLVVGYGVFLIPFPKAAGLSLGIIAGLLAVVIVLCIKIIKSLPSSSV